MATITLVASESGGGTILIAEYYFKIDADGLCVLDKGNAPVFWPASDGPDGRLFALNMTLTINLTDLSGGGLRFAPLIAALTRSTCPAGYSYLISARSCLACLPSQYGAWLWQPANVFDVHALG